ncbi:MAG TPA: hypothetical protein VL527_19415 [Dongiaceae bacterium]|jgi:hypothetical protein|nr:hypothetical protein [Dongiaceae bacterium]
MAARAAQALKITSLMQQSGFNQHRGNSWWEAADKNRYRLRQKTSVTVKESSMKPAVNAGPGKGGCVMQLHRDAWTDHGELPAQASFK